MRVVSALTLVGVLALAPASSQNRGDAVKPRAQLGLGFGAYHDTGPAGGSTDSTPAGALESKVGLSLGANASLSLYSGLVIHQVASGVGYTRWVFQQDEYQLERAFFLSWLIPLAFFLDSHAVVGPMLSLYTSADAPALFVEAGTGFSSNQSVADERYTFGGAVFGGAGVEITRRVGVLLRVIWVPPGWNSRWTPYEGQVLSLLAMLQFG